MTRTSTPIAMTIAGSDSSGGAGIQADLKTFTTLGIYGVCAVTCVVAEHPGRVAAIEAVSPKLLAQQIALNFEAFPIVAAKTGMLYSKELIKAVLDSLKATKQRPKLVVDPVMVATSGTRLLKEDAIKLLTEKLIPQATVITPNLDEAAVLWGEPIPTLPAMREAAFTLQQRFGCSVLVKGGHMAGELAIDILAEPHTVTTFEAPYRKGVNTHGTGCTLSAAITAVLAKGASLEQAVRSGKKFVTRAITRAIRTGPFSVLNHLPAAL